MKTAPDYWYDAHKRVPVTAVFLSRIYAFVSRFRRHYFQTHPHAVYQAPVPLIVVGNITVGGTGKTPLVIALVQFLQQQGYVPGVISRGYGGKGGGYPLLVTPDSDPYIVGDEPVFIAERTPAPVIVDPDRKRAIECLLKAGQGVNVIVSDDGLQHYAMGRDIEMVVIDGDRRFGNERLLPAGPLRENTDRLAEVDFCVANGDAQKSGEFSMRLVLDNPYDISGDKTTSLQAFAGNRVHALAGIGNPQRFFYALQQAGIEVIPHAFADHYQFQEKDLRFADDLPVLITEKDAVKCRKFEVNNVWVVPVTTTLPDAFYQQFLAKLHNIKKG